MKSNYLNSLTILIIDDDEVIREKLSNVFTRLSANVICVENGVDALKKIKNEKIDVVVSDINMPLLDGLTLMEETRKFNKTLDFILISSFSTPEYLMKAIKNSAINYLTKPINLNELIEKINEIGEIKHHKKLLNFKEKENNEYINILNQIAIVSKTDLNGNIKYVNDIFCDISGYTKEELIGKPHNIVRHPDMPSAAFKDLWDTIKSNKIWRGKVKNKSKDGSSYYVNTTVYPMFDDITGETYEYMSVRFLITQEELEKRKFKKNVMKTIMDNKRQNVTARLKIDELEAKIASLEHLAPLKDKNTQLNSQILHYEDEIKKMNQEHLESRKGLKEESSKFYEKYKIELSKNEINSLKIQSLENELELREAEYIKLNEQVLEQNKIIRDLKDVIEHREDQLKNMGLA